MIGNSSEHQGMIPGKTDYQFSFSTTDFMKRFGATQKKELKFKSHFSALRKKKNIIILAFLPYLVNSFPLGFFGGSIRHLWFDIFVKHIQRN